MPPAEPSSEAEYIGRVGEVTRRIGKAGNEIEALALLREASRRAGADAAAFVSFIRGDGRHETYRFLLACDPVWCCEYERRLWYGSDPWLRYACDRVEPIRGRDIPIGSARQRAVVELSERYGFRSAVVVPAPAGGGLSRVGVLCLGSATPGHFDDDDRFDLLKVAACSLSMELHRWWIERIKQEITDIARLTDEDLELLRHERQGHSSKHIARELGTTPASIDSRFQRINARLGVANRRMASQMAAEYGLI